MIETDRLVLRVWRDADRAPYLATCNSAAVTEHLGGPIAPEDVYAAIARLRRGQARHGFGFWAVERRADRALLGYCGLSRIEHPGTGIHREIEIGWRLREDAWGQGFAHEAAMATLGWAWRRLAVRRVVAMTVPANRRSWGLMERLGMTRRPELDFDHPHCALDDPLSRHVTYSIARPA